MKETVKQVAEFMKIFQPQNVATIPCIPTRERTMLRFQLIIEELYELAEATGRDAIIDLSATLLEYRHICNSALAMKEIIPNLISVADALSDLQYVVDGTYVEYGLADIKQELFDEVHRSNLSKMCDSETSLKETIDFYDTQKGVPAISSDFNRMIVVHERTNKVLKAINYSPANLTSIVEKAIPSSHGTL